MTHRHHIQHLAGAPLRHSTFQFVTLVSQAFQKKLVRREERQQQARSSKSSSFLELGLFIWIENHACRRGAQRSSRSCFRHSIQVVHSPYLCLPHILLAGGASRRDKRSRREKCVRRLRVGSPMMVRLTSIVFSEVELERYTENISSLCSTSKAAASLRQSTYHSRYSCKAR